MTKTHYRTSAPLAPPVTCSFLIECSLDCLSSGAAPWNLWMMCLMIAISAVRQLLSSPVRRALPPLTLDIVFGQFFALIAFFGKGSIFFIPAAVFCLAVHAIGGVAIYWRNKNALMVRSHTIRLPACVAAAARQCSSWRGWIWLTNRASD